MPGLKSTIRKFQALCYKYRNQLLNCTYCGDQVVFREWIHHLKTVHDANYSTSCAFCGGHMKWNWGDAQKLLPVAQHRVQCLLDFMKAQSFEQNPVESNAATNIPESSNAATNISEPSDMDLPEPIFPSTGPAPVPVQPNFGTIPEENQATQEVPVGNEALVQNVNGWMREEDWSFEQVADPVDMEMLREIQRLEEKEMVRNPSVVCPPEDEAPCACIHFLMHGRQPDMRGRTRKSEWGSFYEPYGDSTLFDVDRGDCHVKFLETSGLGHEIYNVFDYFFSNQYTFFHVMVRAPLWHMCESHNLLPPGQLHVLPFWCLCDGTHTSDESGPRDHRHMIWMMDKEHVGTFEKNWRRLIEPDVLGRNKLHKQIKDANHLMNTVYYVSNPKSSCDGSVGPSTRAIGSHYWIAREVYPHAKVAMGSLWPEGHVKHLSNLLLHRSIDPFFKYIRRSPLRVQFRYFNLLTRNCPIPLAKEWAFGPNLRAAAPHVYIYACPFRLQRVSHQPTPWEDPEAWFEFQKGKNNLFWNAIWDQEYELGQIQKKTYFTVKRLQDTWQLDHQHALNLANHDVQRFTKSSRLRAVLMSRLSRKFKDFKTGLQTMQHNQKMYHMREKEFQECRQQLQTREQEFQECRQQLKESQQQLQTREKEFQECRQQLKESQQHLQTREQEFQVREQEFQAREAQFQARETLLKDEIHDLQERCINQLERTVQVLQEELRQDKEIISQLQEELRQDKEIISQLQEKLENMIALCELVTGNQP